MSIFEVSADPNEPLSVAEFKVAFDNWIGSIVTTDEEIAAAIAKRAEKLKQAIDDAVRAERFGIYKEVFWNDCQRYTDYD